MDNPYGWFCGVASSQLSLDNVSLSFGPQTVLREQNLDVRRGECVVLTGPSGAGKSVVLKLLAGLIEPSSGHVSVAGRPLSEMNRQERAAIRLKCGMLFQKNALFDSLTVAENVAFPLREKTSLVEAEIQSRVHFYLSAVGLADATSRKPETISGGMQKRLGIARALALEPEIVFYDDPTAGLDPISSRRITALIRELRIKNNSTVVAVTNDMARAAQLDARILLVIDGEIIEAGDLETARHHDDSRVRNFVRGRVTA